MERYVRAELGLTDEEEEEEVIEDFALYQRLPRALSSWSAWKQHGVLPESGGLHDQMESWNHDRMQLDRLYSVMIARLMPEMKDRYQSAPSEDAAEPRATWEDLLDG